MQVFYNNFFFNRTVLLMMSSNFYMFFLFGNACALSGPDSFSNHIQNATYDYKTKLELHFLLIRNLFL